MNESLSGHVSLTVHPAFTWGQGMYAISNVSWPKSGTAYVWSVGQQVLHILAHAVQRKDNCWVTGM